MAIPETRRIQIGDHQTVDPLCVLAVEPGPGWRIYVHLGLGIVLHGSATREDGTKEKAIERIRAEVAAFQAARPKPSG